MRITERRTSTIIEYLSDKYYLSYCRYYGEPGYDTECVAILFCDWNDVPCRIIEYLEKAGYEIEWEGEWIIDDETDKAYRCQPDSLWWKPSYTISDEGSIQYQSN